MDRLGSGQGPWVIEFGWMPVNDAREGAQEAAAPTVDASTLDLGRLDLRDTPLAQVPERLRAWHGRLSGAGDPAAMAARDVACRLPRTPGSAVAPSGLDLLRGAGFEPSGATAGAAGWWNARPLVSLPDVVAPGVSVLVCGLNPSPSSAVDGVAYAKPGNRFWPAALDAGLVPADRDPSAALAAGVGFTDLVKRTTRRAAVLSETEFIEGHARVGRLIAWVRPSVVCVVGLQGWRSAVDARATAGWQREEWSGARVYLMGSTSGLNAHENRTTLADHFSEVGRVAGRPAEVADTCRDA